MTSTMHYLRSTNRRSESPLADFLLHRSDKNSARFKLRKLAENAGLGSRGEGNGAVDKVTVDDSSQSDNLCVWFLDHEPVGECMSSLAGFLKIE